MIDTDAIENKLRHEESDSREGPGRYRCWSSRASAAVHPQMHHGKSSQLWQSRLELDMTLLQQSEMKAVRVQLLHLQCTLTFIKGIWASFW